MQVCSSGSSGIRSTARSQNAWRGSATRGLSGFHGWTGRNSIARGRSSVSRKRSGSSTPDSANQRSRVSSLVGSDSGGGTCGIWSWCSNPGSATWNEASIDKMGWPCWMACTRLAVKLRPSRIRSTS